MGDGAHLNNKRYACGNKDQETGLLVEKEEEDDDAAEATP